jgi:hypothetical protein
MNEKDRQNTEIESGYSVKEYCVTNIKKHEKYQGRN